MMCFDYLRHRRAMYWLFTCFPLCESQTSVQQRVKGLVGHDRILNGRHAVTGQRLTYFSL